ncbi:MAG TPA: hypothetical protein VMG08_10165 [Allosphingosinicella sp.]|nr:hypothetical protein [Allosphingosinicella sp.]
MVSNLFTAFALIATGRVEVPPAPAQPIPAPEIRGYVRDVDADDDADRGVKRR